MGFVACENGHYFDSERSNECPFCDPPGLVVPPGLASAPSPLPSPSLVPPLDPPLAREPSRLGVPTPGPSQPVAQPAGAVPVAPLMGWLVTVGGRATGRDFRLRGGSNWIRPVSVNDEGLVVSAEPDGGADGRSHACVEYDAVSRHFVLRPGEGAEPPSIDNEIARGTVRLEAGARIRVGSNVLVFVPLTGDGFEWSLS